jgi:hypothetical protein
MNNSAWKVAWRAAGSPTGKGVRKGVHILKHTLGRRLRSLGCPVETRKVLLGHRDGDITTHYLAAELEEYLTWLEKITERGSVQTPTLIALNQWNIKWSVLTWPKRSKTTRYVRH